MTVKGIDISGHQNSTYATAGLDFVIVKATEGRTFINPKQHKQAAHARSAGLVLGFYHFLHPGNITAQAEFFVAKADSVKGDILACDWENTLDGTHASGTEKDAFIRKVKQLRPNHRVILYANVDFWLHKDTTSFAGDGLWIAHFNDKPGHPGIAAPWVFHQYTSTPIDKNVGDFADRSALREWAGGGEAGKTASGAKVDLSRLVAAAKADPQQPGTPVSYPGVKRVEKALVREGLLEQALADGHFGTATVAAYAAWQKRCGFGGKDADGIPGRTSLERLGAKHGFRVKD